MEDPLAEAIVRGQFPRDHVALFDPLNPAAGAAITDLNQHLMLNPPAEDYIAAATPDPDSLLALYRDLIALRRRVLAGPVDHLRADDGVLSFRRAGHVIALNTAPAPRPAPRAGAVVRATHATHVPAGTPAPTELEPGEGFIAEL